MDVFLRNYYEAESYEISNEENEFFTFYVKNMTNPIKSFLDSLQNGADIGEDPVVERTKFISMKVEFLPSHKFMESGIDKDTLSGYNKMRIDVQKYISTNEISMCDLEKMCRHFIDEVKLFRENTNYFKAGTVIYILSFIRLYYHYLELAALQNNLITLKLNFAEVLNSLRISEVLSSPGNISLLFHLCRSADHLPRLWPAGTLRKKTQEETKTIRAILVKLLILFRYQQKGSMLWFEDSFVGDDEMSYSDEYIEQLFFSKDRSISTLSESLNNFICEETV